MRFEVLLRGMGARIRTARWLAGTTQEEVAAESGITFRHYAELERGRVNPTLRTLYELSRILGRTVGELVDVERRRSGRIDLRDAEASPPKRGRKAKPKPRSAARRKPT